MHTVSFWLEAGVANDNGMWVGQRGTNNRYWNADRWPAVRPGDIDSPSTSPIAWPAVGVNCVWVATTAHNSNPTVSDRTARTAMGTNATLKSSLGGLVTVRFQRHRLPFPAWRPGRFLRPSPALPEEQQDWRCENDGNTACASASLAHGQRCPEMSTPKYATTGTIKTTNLGGQCMTARLPS